MLTNLSKYSQMFLTDPLEQFNTFPFLIIAEGPHFLHKWAPRCPFHKFIHNAVTIIFDTWDTIYYIFYTTVFQYIPTPFYLIFIWVFIGYIFFIVFIQKRLNNNTKSVRFTNYPVVLEQANSLQVVYSFLNSTNLSVIKTNMTLYRKEFTSLLMFLFIFILACNLSGLFPYTFTISSAFVITFFLAGTHYIGINIIGFFHRGWHFVNLFLPSGVPLVISPFLVLIEFISYLAKVLSLSIRLFANMMSGHALLKILIGFAWGMCASWNLFFITASVVPWVLVTSILFLEALIAFLQAYVFIILVAIYLNDVLAEH